ncbi:MAG: histidinol-phosphate transaminase [Acholeplasmataceae bacterium]
MKDIKVSLKGLKPYRPNKQSYLIKLDANESKNYLFESGIQLSMSEINLYPDTDSVFLRARIGAYISTRPELIIAGNGSSEMIELVLKTYVDKGDVVLSFEPSFSMYGIYTKIHNGTYIPVQTDDTFKLDIDQMIAAAKTYDPKIIFICSPNNPTGQMISNQDIKKLLDATEALVCVDEAYLEFTRKQSSMIDQVEAYDNLVVLRTMSKAFGLAGIRLGYLISNQNVVDTLNRVKSPYNLNTLTQHIGTIALSQPDKVMAYITEIITQRAFVEDALKSLKITYYPSEANFVFFKSEVIDLFDQLLKKGILVRAFSGTLQNYYRVTIGNKEENEQFIDALKEIIK